MPDETGIRGASDHEPDLLVRGNHPKHLRGRLDQRRDVLGRGAARSAGTEPFPAVVVPARSERLRHLRKYADGNLGPKSFFFRGPGQRMNPRAQNLRSFCELASGIDDDTWLFHLRRGDYSAWLSQTIKDDDLGRQVAGIAQDPHLGPFDSRRLIRDAIDRRYMISG